MPTKDPIIPPVSNKFPNLISTAFLLRWPIVPDKEEPTMWFAYDATATAGGIPKSTSKGVIRKPPPTPNIPERIPTDIPNIRKIDGLMLISAIGRYSSILNSITVINF